MGGVKFWITLYIQEGSWTSLDFQFYMAIQIFNFFLMSLFGVDCAVYFDLLFYAFNAHLEKLAMYSTLDKYRVIQNLTPPSREELAGPYQKLAVVHCNIFSLKKVCRILFRRTNYLLHKMHSRRRACSRFFRVFTPVLP